MQLGIFAKTFPGSDPLAILLAAKEAGYDVVQYNMACSGVGSLPVRISQNICEEIANAADYTGVGVAAISATYNMIHPDMEIRAEGRAAFKAIAGATGRIGCRLLTVCTGSRDAADQWRHHPENRSSLAWEDLCMEFRRILEFADRYDVDIGVEPELGNVVNSAARAAELLDQLGSERIKIVFDPANLMEHVNESGGKSIVDAGLSLLAGRIALAHAKDRTASGAFAAVGKGALDFAHYIDALKRVGFTGPLVTHGLAASEASEVGGILRKELAGG